MTDDTKYSKSSDEALQEYLSGWNWGACCFGLIWGFGNNVSISFRSFYIPFELGLNGNKWAWEQGNWRNLEHCKRTQRKWAYAVLVYFLMLFLLALISILLTIV